MSTKKQFKLYLEPDIVERIEAAAVKSGKRSAQEVVEELIAIYLPVWSTINDSVTRAIEYQIKTFSEDIAEKKVQEMNQTEAVKKARQLKTGKIFKESSEDDYTLLASRQESEKKEDD